MIVPVMAISNLVLTRQIYSEETNGTHAHYREPVPLISYNLGENMPSGQPVFNVWLKPVSKAIIHCSYLPAVLTFQNGV